MIPRLIRIFATVFSVLSVMLASAQDSQEFRDLKAQVEQLQVDQINREWRELEVQQKAEEAKHQAEMEAISAYRQQIPPLPQPDTGTDSLVKELRDIKDEREQSRLDADFRQYQAALQARLDAMTPEQRERLIGNLSGLPASRPEQTPSKQKRERRLKRKKQGATTRFLIRHTSGITGRNLERPLP